MGRTVNCCNPDINIYHRSINYGELRGRERCAVICESMKMEKDTHCKIEQKRERERERERVREIMHHSQSLAFNHLFEEKKRLDNIVDIFAV